MPVLIPKNTVLKPHATIIITDPAVGREIQRDVLQCKHCQTMWVVVPGSGRRRGFCTRCNGPTCGAEACDTCLHFEKRAEMIEAGKSIVF